MPWVFAMPVRRSTLADANEGRDWRIYAELAQRLIAQARKLYLGEDLGFDLANTVYALDSTTIDSLPGGVSVGAFPHGQGGGEDAHAAGFARKYPELYPYIRRQAPRRPRTSICCSSRLAPSMSWIAATSISAGFTVCIWLARSSSRAPNRIWISPPRSLTRPRADRAAGIICDQTIALDGHYTAKSYPEHLRRIRFRDPETAKTLIFLTNQFSLLAATVCALYKSRWQVELFFKWIKQHLRIKRFYGTSENAVKTQIWIAVSVYVLVAIV